MFQRFTVVMEYQQKPVLPPPLIAFCHFYSLIKYCFRKAKGLQKVRDNGLKLFLEKDEMNRLYDFEEECVEGFFQEQNMILLQSTEERIKNTDEKVENMSQKIEDINTKENLQALSIQNMEFRLRKMEESTEQILNHLAVIHRFMSIDINSEYIKNSVANLSLSHPVDVIRNRAVSENDSTNLLTSIKSKPLKYNRSLIEVKPQELMLDNGVRSEVKTEIEENKMIYLTDEAHDYTGLWDCKLSVQSKEPEYSIRKSSESQCTQKNTESENKELKKHMNLDLLPSLTAKLDLIQRQSLNFQHNANIVLKNTLPEGCNNSDLTLIDGANELDEVEQQRFGLRRRNSQKDRRNSESQHFDINRSQNSLNFTTNALITKRQFSLTQSEPDTDVINGGIIVLKPNIKTNRHLLLQIHTEYTSITDELESMITSPTNSLEEKSKRNVSELSDPEFAALMEKKHLKECEDDDYVIMEGLLQAKNSFDESNDNLDEGFQFDYSREILSRETAIELPNINIQKDCNVSATIHASRNNDSLKLKKMPEFFNISNDSLDINSSSDNANFCNDTHPYKVLKQNSNDTNSSIKNESSAFMNTKSDYFTAKGASNSYSIDKDRKYSSKSCELSAQQHQEVVEYPKNIYLFNNDSNANSSTNTENSKKVSKHLVQDEIANFSLNINNSIEESDKGEKSLETVC